jgi:dynein heavy chain
MMQVSRNDRLWKQWFDKDAPEEEVIPDGYNSTLDVFRRLLLVRSWCPDRTLPQAKKYIADTLGPAFAEGVILDIERMSKESNNRTPMIGLLSLGSDPTNSIESLAKKSHLGTLPAFGDSALLVLISLSTEEFLYYITVLFNVCVETTD